MISEHVHVDFKIFQGEQAPDPTTTAFLSHTNIYTLAAPLAQWWLKSRALVFIPTQQKQIGCFNHTVVTLVADKLRRQWLCNVNFANCIRQPERKLPRPSTEQDLVDIVTTDHASLKEVTPACTSKRACNNILQI